VTVRRHVKCYMPSSDGAHAVIKKKRTYRLGGAADAATAFNDNSDDDDENNNNNNNLRIFRSVSAIANRGRRLRRPLKRLLDEAENGL
jgi:hypothetical protein